MTRRRGVRRSCLLAATALVASWPALANTPLQPYQMVRSLQVIQDRLADGDHAALPMQRKVLEMIDARLRAGTADDFVDRRNFRALLIYGMSGGNPSTLQATLSRLTLDEPDAKLSTAIVDYLRGDSGRALSALNGIDPRDMPTELGSFLALVKGTVSIAEKPDSGFTYFDQARLLGPGTLVEEAALRRTIALATQQKNTTRFLRASDQYTRRFLRSPYASQFADTFLAGVLELRQTIDLPKTAEIIGQMTGEQSKVIYLRIARRAAIEGLDTLVEFARAGLDGTAPEKGNPEDPRAVLYESLASIASERVSDVKLRLDAIDRAKLSANDRRLLDAARALVEKVVAEPASLTTEEPSADAPDAGETAVPPDGAAIETIVETPHGTAGAVAAAAGKAIKTVEAAPENKFMVEARRRLDEIDRLLGENTE